jgi:pyruvate/2-oxoglutarate dehydrogenase complex dihydrolipoamide acyltransferase (E2) component
VKPDPLRRRHTLILPDLELADCPIKASLWLVPRGSRVAEGDALLEVVAGSATVDLPSPVAGVLKAKLVAEEQTLAVGQELAVIEVEPQ